MCKCSKNSIRNCGKGSSFGGGGFLCQILHRPLFDRAKVHSREGREGGAAQRRNDDSLPRELKSPKLDLEEGEKREIHEYWVLLLSTLRVHHTLDLPLFRDPQQIRSSRKKVPMDSESKDPETELAFQETKETEVVIVSPE